VGNVEVKLTQYADDTTCFVRDLGSIQRIFELHNQFQLASGLKLNKDKVEAMWMGKKRNSTKKPLNMNWTKNLKILGVTFSYNKNIMVENNFLNKIKKTEDIFKIWNMRNLTLQGRVLLSKSLGYSNFMYVASILDVPSEIIKIIDKIMYKFVWKNKPDKVKRVILISDYGKGGQKMSDFESCIKAARVQYVKSYLNSNDASFKSIFFKYYFPEYGGPDFLFRCNFDAAQISMNKNLPPFYVSILETWKEFVSIVSNSQNVSLWNNVDIKIENQTVFYAEFFRSGIRSIYDLLQNNKYLSFDLLSKRGLQQKYYMKWRGIVDAIPTKLKKYCTEHIPVFNDPLDELFYKGTQIKLHSLNSKTIYQIFLSQKALINFPRKIHLSNLYNRPIDDVSCWEEIFSCVSLATLEPILRELHYKILHNYFPCNSLLQKMKIKQSDTCDLCKTNTETTTHLFWYCPVAQQFWSNWKGWLVTYFPNIAHLSEDQIILGFSQADFGYNSKNLNLLLIKAKQFIFYTKLGYHPLSLELYKIEIKRIFDIENTIANRNGRLYLFLRKWVFAQHLL